MRADTLVQERPDGGIRALHPALFATSLRLTWIRRFLDPAPQLWKNLVWEYVQEAYGFLRQGELLLASSLDFSRLPIDMPPLFRTMLIEWGRLCTPQRNQPSSHEAVLVEPLLFNPIARRDESFASNQYRAYRRPVSTDAERLRNAQWRVAGVMSNHGLCVVQDLLPFLTIRQYGDLHTLSIHRARLQATFPRCRKVLPFVQAVTEAWPLAWLALLHAGPRRIEEGTWVAWGIGRVQYGRVISSAAGPNLRIRVYEPDHMMRMHDTGREEQHTPGPPHRIGVAWRGFLSLADQRLADAIEFGHAHTSHDNSPRFTWRWQGLLACGALDLSSASLVTDTTLRDARATPFSLLRNRHIYAALVARLYRIGNAFPTALASGEWSTMRMPDASDVQFRADASLAFSLAHVTCLPLRAQQSLYQFMVTGLPIGSRTGSDSMTAGLCPTCVATGHWVHHTHEHLMLACPLACQLWQTVMREWLQAFPDQVWVRPLLNAYVGLRLNSPPPSLSLEVRRAVCLGLRPPAQRRHLAAPFTLLRGAVLATLLKHHWRAEREASMSGVDTSSSGIRRASLLTHLRANVVSDYQHAVRCERARAVQANAVILAAGGEIGPDNDALERWRREWARSGICTDSEDARLLVFRPWAQRAS